MSRQEWAALIRQLAALGETSRCEKDILAGILSRDILTPADQRCLLAMRDKHLGAPTKVMKLHQPPIRRQQR